jgi:hypothetical protein
MNDRARTSGVEVIPKQQSIAELINSNLNEILDRTGGMVNRLNDMERFILGSRPDDPSETEKTDPVLSSWKHKVMATLNKIQSNISDQEEAIENLEQFHK